MALYALCMYLFLLCNVDVMISILQKCLQDVLLSLVGPSSSFRIGSHLGRDKSPSSFLMSDAQEQHLSGKTWYDDRWNMY